MPLNQNFAQPDLLHNENEHVGRACQSKEAIVLLRQEPGESNLGA